MIEKVNWGLIDYENSVRQQTELVEAVSLGQKPDSIVFCTHPPVVTKGRTTPETDITDWNGAIVESSRGGRATYHGPNQLVIYPIVDLKTERRGLPSRHIQAFIKLIGSVMVETVKTFGVESELRQGLEIDEDGFRRQLTGIWVGNRKLASIGVAVRKWVTYHGIAVNLESDEMAFRGIRPCGFRQGVMVSLQELLGQPIARDEFIEEYFRRLSVELEPRTQVAFDRTRASEFSQRIQ